ncbi:MAG: hypothetical protein NTX30_00120 [Deltaproteobacteria bacterium]|nr:hypothetical protein [Deltaproteobacteria bacterium]
MQGELTPLFNPRSIAIVGPSDDLTRIGGLPIRFASAKSPILPLMTQETFSGHSLKHLLSAWAVFLIYRMPHRRRFRNDGVMQRET